MIISHSQSFETRKEYQRFWSKLNPESVRRSWKKYRASHKPEQAEYMRRWRQSSARHKETSRQWVVKNRATLNANQRRYYAQHREEIRLRRKPNTDADREKQRLRYREQRASIRNRHNAWRRSRYKSDPQYVIRCRLRARLAQALKGGGARKCLSSQALVGIDLNGLMAHIESLFLPGMNWNNRHLWHIDHVRPCVAFDLTTVDGQKQCFHYTNLQPLWAKANRIKSFKH